MRQECGAIYLDVGRADGVLRLSNGYMGGLLYPENPSMVDAAAFVADSISGHKIHGKIYCLPSLPRRVKDIKGSYAGLTRPMLAACKPIFE